MRSIYNFAVVVLMLARAASAADYHFSALGSDSAGDGSLANPWQSIGKLNSLDLNPGDNVLLRANDTFAGNIVLDATDTATSATGIFSGNPISLGSYGLGGRPIISSPTGQALIATNVGGLEIHGLEFAGSDSLSNIASPSNTSNGLMFDNTNTFFQQQHIYLDDIVVHGFGEAGINLHANNPTINSGGFADVRITNSEVYSNGRSGIVSSVSSTNGLVVGGAEYDFYARAHANFSISNNRVHDTTGKNGAGGVSGNGIVLAQVDGAIIERNIAHHNGGQAGGGGVGIWAWEGDHIAIRYNEAYSNQSFDGRDGGGYDLDGGVNDSVMEYNYSHGNEGAGLGLFQYSYASQMGGNTIRYNISEDDGAGLSVWGNGPRYPGSDAAEDSIYHNNTVINPKGPAVHFFGSVDDVGLYNNIFVAAGGQPLVKLEDWDGAGSNYTLDVDLRNNAYWSSSGAFLIQWANANYGSLSAWANATGQEKFAGALIGKQTDPLLVGPFFGGVTLDDPALLASLSAYRLLATSPLIDAAGDLASFPLAVALGLTDAGTRDFFGGSIPIFGAFDMGAHESFAPGDFNGNGTVDAADYVLWRNGLGATHVLAEYSVWREHFGQSAGIGSRGRSNSAVPEPAAVEVLLLGMLAILAHRRAIVS